MASDEPLLVSHQDAQNEESNAKGRDDVRRLLAQETNGKVDSDGSLDPAEDSNGADKSEDAAPARWSMREVAKLARENAAGDMACALVALVVSSGTNLALPKIMGWMVDLVVARGPGASGSVGGSQLLENTTASGRPSVAQAAWAALGVFAAGAVGSIARVFFLSSAETKIARRLRVDLYRATLQYGPVEQDANAVISCLAQDAEDLSKSICKNIASLYRGCNSAFGGAAMLCYISPQLTMVSLSLLPMIGSGAFAFSRFSRRIAKSVKEDTRNAVARAGERVQQLATVRMFNGEKREVERFASALDGLCGRAGRAALAEGLFMGGLGFSLNASLLAVVCYGGRLVAAGSMTGGQLASFAMYSGLMGLGFGQLGSAYSDFSRSLGASQRLKALLADMPASGSTPTPRPEGDAIAQQILDPVLRFENVHFAYAANPDKEILRGLDLTLEPGKVVCIAGRSGVGKSTLSKLIMRVEQDWQGQITLDGRDIREIPLTAYRTLLSAVDQRPALFTDLTIAENIAFSRPGASEDEVREAARMAEAFEFIEALPDGFASIVGGGPKSVQLSVGQAQRIALARAFLRRARVYIFDEHSSSLDHRAEQDVQRSVRGLAARGCAVVVIAHRASMLEAADHIVVLENGAVAEQGTFADLLAKPDGPFRDLLSSLRQRSD
ncbi:ABC transporter B family member 25 [Hondaea fermentalgiana]|uniref:ABC transporter B family member 25 n=1 Tax=Hondaea fermentalgiana TaxID=2315210 RepID=A0A2R5GK98_9STRA|nr:ABC transporter B family member 25 [Hondaea fermentalgiana]|eukprot:GBG31336.1 ABC transporter B family member 25 [Hondaea fermentalgiana]